MIDHADIDSIIDHADIDLINLLFVMVVYMMTNCTFLTLYIVKYITFLSVNVRYQIEVNL